jgi:hypothetical protein
MWNKRPKRLRDQRLMLRLTRLGRSLGVLIMTGIIGKRLVRVSFSVLLDLA